MTDVVPAEHLAPPVPVMEMLGLPSPAEFGALRAMSEQLAMSNLVPGPLRGKPADIMVILLTGRDLRIGVTMALSRVFVVDGKPSMSAELMTALVLRAGHRIWPDEANDATKATVYGLRDGQQTSETFTLEDARIAGLAGRGPWKAYPKAMLWARATSSLCRHVFPDVLLGVTYTPEEIGAEVTEDGEMVAVAPPKVVTPDDLARNNGWADTADKQAAALILKEASEIAGDEVAATVRRWCKLFGVRPAFALGWAATMEALAHFAAYPADDIKGYGTPQPAPCASLLNRQQLAHDVQERLLAVSVPAEGDGTLPAADNAEDVPEGLLRQAGML